MKKSENMLVWLSKMILALVQFVEVGKRHSKD
jgi:hypothetical protein